MDMVEIKSLELENHDSEANTRIFILDLDNVNSSKINYQYDNY